MITLISWGFKYGDPPANFKFDVSYLKNPWREKGLRNASKERIIDFMKEQEGFDTLISSFVILIMIYNNLFPNENLIFAFCCSAGEYRSPVVVEILHQRLEEKNIHVRVINSVNSKL